MQLRIKERAQKELLGTATIKNIPLDLLEEFDSIVKDAKFTRSRIVRELMQLVVDGIIKIGGKGEEDES